MANITDLAIRVIPATTRLDFCCDQTLACHDSSKPPWMNENQKRRSAFSFEAVTQLRRQFQEEIGRTQ